MNLILKKSAACLLVVLTMIFVSISSVFADSPVTISGNQCSSGDTVTYICMIKIDKKLSGINATVKYPAASLELQKESVNVPNLGMTIANTNDEGRIRFIGVNAQDGFDFTEKKLLADGKRLGAGAHLLCGVQVRTESDPVRRAMSGPHITGNDIRIEHYTAIHIIPEVLGIIVDLHIGISDVILAADKSPVLIDGLSLDCFTGLDIRD